MRDEIKGKIHWEISANEKTTDLMRKYTNFSENQEREKELYVKKKKFNILKASFIYRYRKRYDTEINNMYIDRSGKYLLPDQSNIRKSVIFAINLRKTNKENWVFRQLLNWLHK